MFEIQQRVKPILKWAGGKSSSLNQLIQHFPKKFDRFLEPFAGGGAVFFCLQPGIGAVLNDSNQELMDLYKVIRARPHDLMDSLDALAAKYSEAFFYQVRESKPASEVDQAARLLFLNKTCFNGLYRLNSKGAFNAPFGRRPECPVLYERQNLLAASERLESASLRSEDFEVILNAAKNNDFVYCDPPYLPLSKTACFSSYTRFGFPYEAHERLREAAVRASKRGAYVAISNSSSPLVDKIYEGFERIGTRAKRAISCKGGARGEVREILVVLKPEPRKGLRARVLKKMSAISPLPGA